MATWDTGKGTFTCQKCGAIYECTYKDFPASDPLQIFKCEIEGCDGTVHSWKGTRDYFDWKVKPSAAPAGNGPASRR